jgi:ABC-type glycerol-3-phosphate transport system substrate-binding protein
MTQMFSKTTVIGVSSALLVAAGLFRYLAGEADHLVFVTWGTPNEVHSFQRLIDYFNETRKPKYPVKLSHAEQTSYTEQLLVQAAAHSLPDVIHIDQKDIPLFVHRGLLEDLTPLFARDSSFDPGIFLPRLLQGCAVRGRYYAVPHNFSTFVLYFNKSHFDAEGMSYPDSTWTWDTFLKAARRLTRRDASGETTRYGCFVEDIIQTFIYQNGGEVLNKTLDSCVVASPEAAEAVQFVEDLSHTYHVTWNTLAQNLLWDDMFIGGRCSMVSNGRWVAGYYAKALGDQVDVAPLPRGKYRRGAYVNHTMVISSESTKKEEAWEFIKFLVSEQGQKMVNNDGANIPAVTSIATSDAFLHHHQTPAMHNRVFLDELPYSVGWPFEVGPYVTYHTLQSQLDLATRRILLDEATTIQSLRIMQQTVNGVLAGQLKKPEPREFVGSILSYLCAVLVAGTLLIIRTRRRANAARHQ